MPDGFYATRIFPVSNAEDSFTKGILAQQKSTKVKSLAKQTKARGEFIDIALGKNKIPESIIEMIQLTILKHGRRNHD